MRYSIRGASPARRLSRTTVSRGRRSARLTGPTPFQKIASRESTATGKTMAMVGKSGPRASLASLRCSAPVPEGGAAASCGRPVAAMMSGVPRASPPGAASRRLTRSLDAREFRVHHRRGLVRAARIVDGRARQPSMTWEVIVSVQPFSRPPEPRRIRPRHRPWPACREQTFPRRGLRPRSWPHRHQGYPPRPGAAPAGPKVGFIGCGPAGRSRLGDGAGRPAHGRPVRMKSLGGPVAGKPQRRQARAVAVRHPRGDVSMWFGWCAARAACLERGRCKAARSAGYGEGGAIAL